MNQKQRQRLGSAIASTILSLFSAVSLVGVDQVKAAVLTYNFQAGGGGSNLNFFKVDNSSLTGIGVENIAVSEGRFYDYTLGGGKEYYDLAGKIALFDLGELRGLQAGGGDQAIVELIIPPGEPFGPLYVKSDRRISWRIETYRTGFTTWASLLNGYSEEYRTIDNRTNRTNTGFFRDVPVSYTLVDTAAEPVPEPITVAGTTLALAGLSWLKHKKKMAA